MVPSDNLYTDGNPESTVNGLGFKDEDTAIKSVERLKKLVSKNEITENHALQAAISMEQRSVHHPHRNSDMRAAEIVYRNFIETLKAD